MLVKKDEIMSITMCEMMNASNTDCDDFCVVFNLDDGQIILPCFYAAGFPLDDEPELKEEQIRKTQNYIDAHPKGCYFELSASLLYGMNVYH